MMGKKERHFAPLINVSIEQLVPQDHYLERTLDLSFVSEFVQETYAGIGRPSIDPVVFFKLQLVLFFEGLRSERQLMRHAAESSLLLLPCSVLCCLSASEEQGIEPQNCRAETRGIRQFSEELHHCSGRCHAR